MENCSLSLYIGQGKQTLQQKKSNRKLLTLWELPGKSIYRAGGNVEGRPRESIGPIATDTFNVTKDGRFLIQTLSVRSIELSQSPPEFRRVRRRLTRLTSVNGLASVKS